MRKRKRLMILGRIFIAVCLVVALFPIYWMINTSFKTDYEIYSKVPTWYPHHFSLDAYRHLLTETNFLSGMKNSLIIASIVSLFSIVVAYPVA